MPPIVIKLKSLVEINFPTNKLLSLNIVDVAKLSITDDIDAMPNHVLLSNVDGFVVVENNVGHATVWHKRLAHRARSFFDVEALILALHLLI